MPVHGSASRRNGYALELTESRVVRNRQAARAFLQRIRATGACVALR
jgi:EAL domain-containing protein (putative c-di-GMP-specific phosphodiesterase class I)